MNVLKKSSLKVFDVEWISGKEALEKLVENKTRRYKIDERVCFCVHTNQINLMIETMPGFEFDGRSGPKIVDWYAPNLGTLLERVCWFVHDVNGYGKCLSFEDTNVLLYAMLRDLCHYRKSKAALIQLAVSLSRSWYGTPKVDDWCYKNLDKITYCKDVPYDDIPF